MPKELPEGFPKSWHGGDVTVKEPNGRWKIDPKWAVSVAFIVIGWVVTVALAWGSQDARMSVIETKQQENERRLERIELKVDQLLQRP